MFFRKLNIKIFYLIVFVFLFVLTPRKNFSQLRYDFDFDSEWLWEDLMDKAVLIDPQLIKSVGDLKKKISIDDARIILKELSRLEKLKDLQKLPEISFLDTSKAIKWDSLFKKTFENFIFSEDFSGLIKSSLKISDLREAHKKEDVFEFENRSYLLQPIKRLEKEFEINFDYAGAERVLNFFEGNGFPDEIFETEPYKEIITKKNTAGLHKNFFLYNLTQAAIESPIYSIYKWVNPRSLWDFGGVSVYKKQFRNVIKTIRENENNIRFDIEKNISKYLPEGIFFKAGLMFLFGKNNPVWVSSKNKLCIDLEYFGDDYSYLVRYIIHQIFIIAQKKIQLPVEVYVVDSKDIVLIKLLSNMFEHGSANYVGPIGTETRPWDLLEKDFLLFNKTFSHIYNKDGPQLINNMINMGYSGNAPFYTMATQMAYIIETTIGRSALVESIKLGPIFFFGQYIKAYNEYPDKIRKVFTFPKTFEKKISDLKLLFPESPLKDALDIKEFLNQPIKIDEMILKFFETHGNSDRDNGLLNFLAGQLLLESGQFEKAKEYFLKGLEEKKEQELILEIIGKSFMQHNAFHEALEFFNLFVESSSGNYRAYELRGEYFYETGDLAKAQDDFEKALTIYPGSGFSENFLKKINSEKQ